MKFKSMFTLVALLLYSTVMYAQTTNTSGNWSSAGNWSSPSSVPINTSGTLATPVTVNHAMILDQNISISTGVYHIYGNVTDVAGGSNYTLSVSNASYSATQSIFDVKSGTVTFGGTATFNNANIFVRNGATLIIGALTTGGATEITVDAGGTLIVNGSVTDNNISSGSIGLITVNGLFQVNGNYTASQGGVRVGPNPATTGSFYVTGTMTTSNATGSIFGATNNATGSFNSGRALACGASGNAYTSVISGGYSFFGGCTPPTMTFSSNGSVSSRQWQVSTTGSAGTYNDISGATGTSYTPSTGQTTNKWYRVKYQISGCSGSPFLYSYPAYHHAMTGTNTWTGVTSSDWNTTTNWSSGTVPDAYTDVVIASGTPNNPTTPTSDVTLRTLTVNSSASLTIPSGGYYVKLSCGSGLVNNGTISSSGSINFEFINGTQTVSGASKVVYDRIKVTNASLTFESDADLVKEMTLAGSTTTVDFDGSSNNKVFTFKSSNDNPDNSARLASVPSGASVSGNVKWERYVTKPAVNMWTTFATPITGSTVAQLQTTHRIYGNFTGSSGQNPSNPFGISNVRWYDETQILDDPDYIDGIIDLEDGFNRFPTTSNTETFDVGKGYWLWLWTTYNPLLSAPSALFSFTGTLNTGNFPVTITNTNSGTGIAYNDGWNSIGNPYVSFIDVSSGITNIDKTTNIFSVADYESDGVFRAYNATTGIGVNGGTQYIAPGQSFWVQADINDGYGSKTLTFTEDMKVANPPGGQYFRQMGIDDILRLDLTQTATPSNTEESVIHFYSGASTGVDTYYDVRFMDGRSNANPSAFGISSSVSGVELAINALPPSAITSSTVYVNTFSPDGTSLTLDFSETGSFASNVGIKMTDLVTSSVRDVRFDPSDYVFTAVADQSTPRFKFEFVQSHTVTGHVSGVVSTGSSYQITGTGFSTTPSNQTVRFLTSSGYVDGYVTAATTTQLTVTVPSGVVNGSYVRVVKDGLTKVSPSPLTVKYALTVNYRTFQSTSEVATIYYRKNGGSWTSLASIGSYNCNSTDITQLGVGDVIEFAVEYNGTNVVYLTSVGNDCEAGDYHGGSRTQVCSYERFSYTMTGSDQEVGITAWCNGHPSFGWNLATCEPLTSTLVVYNKVQVGSSSAATVYYRVNGGSWVMGNQIYGTSTTNFSVNGLQVGDVVDFAVEDNTSSSSIEYWATSGTTPPTSGTIYGDNRSGACPTYSRYSTTITSWGGGNDVALTVKGGGSWMGNFYVCQTYDLYVNVRAQASASTAAVFYYRKNGGSWQSFTATSGTSCISGNTISGFAPGDIVEITVEKSSTSTPAAHYVANSSGSTCITSGTAYSNNRSNTCGDPYYSYTFGSANKTIGIYVLVSGSDYVGCY